MAGLLLAVAGSLILVFGIPGAFTEQTTEIEYRTISELTPGTPEFPRFESRFPIQRIERISVSIGEGRPFQVDVAHYRSSADHPRQAMIFLPEESTAAPETDLNRLRSQAWLDASQFFRDLSPANRLLVTWWDNAQRMDLLSGAKAWIEAPVEEAFDRGQRDFWKHVSGGFANSSAPIKQFAAWLLSDAEQALQEMDKTVDPGSERYLLVSIDDLARLSEIEALSGKPVPFETRLFRADENIHRLISRVKRWAREKGNGSYLVQHIGGAGVRVWRITTVEGEKTLLARLLPFTSSLATPLTTLDLVHRSEWSGFLSVYRWKSSRPERVAR